MSRHDLGLQRRVNNKKRIKLVHEAVKTMLMSNALQNFLKTQADPRFSFCRSQEHTSSGRPEFGHVSQFRLVVLGMADAGLLSWKLRPCERPCYAMLLLLLLLLLLAARAFPGWHVLKLEFWHFPLPKFILRFLFLSVFAVFLAK